MNKDIILKFLGLITLLLSISLTVVSAFGIVKIIVPFTEFIGSSSEGDLGICSGCAAIGFILSIFCGPAILLVSLFGLPFSTSLMSKERTSEELSNHTVSMIIYVSFLLPLFSTCVLLVSLHYSYNIGAINLLWSILPIANLVFLLVIAILSSIISSSLFKMELKEFYKLGRREMKNEYERNRKRREEKKKEKKKLKLQKKQKIPYSSSRIKNPSYTSLRTTTQKQTQYTSIKNIAQREENFRKILKRYAVISMKDMAKLLFFDDVTSLQEWLLSIPDNIEFIIEGNKVLIPKKLKEETEEIENIIDDLIDSFKSQTKLS